MRAALDASGSDRIGNFVGIETMSQRFVRLLILSLIVLFAAVPLAFADEPEAAVDGGFWATLIRMLLSFNSRGLLELLGKPQFAIPAFIAVNLIVFVETGLLVGFFLPGDSLLVMVGLIASNPACNWNLPLLLVSVSLAAIIGDTVGYSIGYKAGPMIFNREKSLFFKRDHLLAAQAFYEKHGGKTIILARFIPILRTFAPVVAGVGRMQYRRFLAFNVVGGVSWVCSMILIGYYLPAVLNPMFRPYLGEQFQVQDHVEKVVVLVVFLSVLPGIVVWAKNRLSGRAAVPDQATIAI
jgi:membrane-associated protein